MPTVAATAAAVVLVGMVVAMVMAMATAVMVMAVTVTVDGRRLHRLRRHFHRVGGDKSFSDSICGCHVHRRSMSS